MRSKGTALLLALALAALLIGGTVAYRTLAPSAQAPVSTGAQEDGQGDASSQPTPAPSFQMEDSTGEVLEFSQFLGEQPVVLNFWASTCSPCKAEMPDLQAAYDAYGEDIHFVLVNVGAAMDDSREQAEAYLAQEGYTLPVYYDLDFNAISAYGANAFPLTFFIDAGGNLSAYWKGQMTPQVLQTGLNLIAPDLVEAP